jgi:hypothetical protein
VRLFAFILNALRTRVNELRPPLMSQRGNFIKRWNPNGWIWRLVPRSSSVWICFSKPGNFASVYLRLICVSTAMDECCLRPSIRPLSLKSTSSDADVVAPNTRDVFALMIFPVDGVRKEIAALVVNAGLVVWKWQFFEPKPWSLPGRSIAARARGR